MPFSQKPERPGIWPGLSYTDKGDGPVSSDTRNRPLSYLRRCKKATYTALLIEGKLPDYLADVNEQAEEMISQLVKQMAKDEGVDEAFKRRNQLSWVQKMNSIRSRAEEIVLNEIIYQ